MEERTQLEPKSLKEGQSLHICVEGQRHFTELEDNQINIEI